jgi:hypothetical protein
MLGEEPRVRTGGPRQLANRQQQHKNFENFQEAHHPLLLDMAGTKLTQTLLWIFCVTFCVWIFYQRFRAFSYRS